MKCPECKRNFGSRDVRVVAFHLSCHKMPYSIVLTILRKMGYKEEDLEQFSKYPFLDLKRSNGSTQRFQKLLEKEKAKQ